MANHAARSSANKSKVLVAASILAVAGLAMSAVSLAFLRNAVPEQVESKRDQAEDRLTH
jgi:hypothetical protein